MKMNTATQISIFERNAALAENGLAVLDRYCPENKSMFADAEGKRTDCVGRVSELH